MNTATVVGSCVYCARPSLTLLALRNTLALSMRRRTALTPVSREPLPSSMTCTVRPVLWDVSVRGFDAGCQSLVGNSCELFAGVDAGGAEHKLFADA